MNSQSTQNEILTLENRYWQAMKDSDIESAVSMTHFPCLVAGPSGVMRVDEASYKKMMASNKGKTQDFEIKNAEVEMINADTAVIAYQLKSNGKECFDSSTWVREDGNWLCALHTEVPQSKN
jgi:hypothetical protein